MSLFSILRGVFIGEIWSKLGCCHQWTNAFESISYLVCRQAEIQLANGTHSLRLLEASEYRRKENQRRTKETRATPNHLHSSIEQWLFLSKWEDEEGRGRKRRHRERKNKRTKKKAVNGNEERGSGCNPRARGILTLVGRQGVCQLTEKAFRWDDELTREEEDGSNRNDTWLVFLPEGKTTGERKKEEAVEGMVIFVLVVMHIRKIVRFVERRRESRRVCRFECSKRGRNQQTTKQTQTQATGRNEETPFFPFLNHKNKKPKKSKKQKNSPNNKQITTNIKMATSEGIFFASGFCFIWIPNTNTPHTCN